MNPTEALRLAREALVITTEAIENIMRGDAVAAGNAAIEAIDAALAEPDYDAPERRCGGPGCDGNCCQPAWQEVSLRVGEELSDVGPDRYYRLGPNEWRDWAIKKIRELKAETDTLRTCLLQAQEAAKQLAQQIKEVEDWKNEGEKVFTAAKASAIFKLGQWYGQRPWGPK